jgi:hypothetical protein
MFVRGMLRPSVRDRQFYDAIAALPNTTLANINQDSFELIDHASCVATITGTVGFQAVLRGRPVIVFGAAPYRHCPSVFHVSNLDDLRAAITPITTNYVVPDDESIMRYAIWVEGISFGAEGLKEEKDWYSKNYEDQCLVLALSRLVSSGWDYEKSDYRLHSSRLVGAHMSAHRDGDSCEVS